MSDYISVIYDETRTPRTEYPFQMASYLFTRFHLQKGQKLLEIGCGRGEFLNAFQQLGMNCYGVDLSEHGFYQLSDIKVAKVDISRDVLPFDNNSFDIVYHKSLIEHLCSPDHLMIETCRVLKPGGRVIILTPDWTSQMKVFYEDYTHSRPYTVTALSDLLTVYGFRNVESELFYQLPIYWRYPQLRIIAFLLHMFLSTPAARYLTKVTGLKIFRWSVELMVLASSTKQCPHS
jgi:ubiquinone/menaquinone biosynthesis C-methylase UbiE